MDCFHCFDCCKSSTDQTSELRRKGEETNGCFCCKRSSKEERKGRTRGVCGVGCFFICESTAKDYSSGAKSCCCFPCINNKSSGKNEEARVMKKNKKKKNGCFHCFRLCDSNSLNKEKKGTCSCYDGSSWCCFSCCNGESSKVSNEEKVKSSEKKPEKQLKKKKKRGKKVTCCCGSCCSKPLDERRPASKRSCESILSCLCCIYTRKTDSSMKKKKRKKSVCLRWRTKPKEEKGNQLATLVHSMSFKSDSGGKNRFNAKEILRLGNINIASRVFTYKELMAATNNFKADCLLGSGGFGRVYKGQLAGTNEVIAVKKLDRSGYQGSREFLIEVLMLGLLQHPNLVKLLGYCAERDQRILVYEYMPFGSLHDHLLDILPKNKPLDWFTRMKIAVGAAKGLEHLHDVANPPVIYRDMKASNILLDENYNPKLSDFGLAKLGPTGDKTHVSTRVMGTYGYCAPEYALTGQLTKMSDVYSFGVLFLELITGRQAIDITRPKAEQHLAHWAETLFKEKRKLVGMADPILRGKFPKKGLCQALAVADMCIQNEASTRPLISDVVSAIEYLANPSPASPAINGRIMPLKFASSEHERRTSENSSFDEENNGREILANTSFDEGKHTRTRTADLSFDEETFQSLSSETGSLREEEI